MDKHEWMLTRLNNRMASLRAAPRDPATCIGYLDGADTELHRVLGFYGDRERTESILGARHRNADIHNQDGQLPIRYVVFENAPHPWPVTAGAHSWDFMKQYRRDTATGRIVVDEYSARDDAPTRNHKDVQENTP
jgi:hypothetical protein